jgi:hypothetical protein
MSRASGVERDARPPAAERGVVANARLTASTAVALFLLLAAEGVTVLRVRPLLTPHVFIGVLLVPPVLLKIGSTLYRFARYYLGSPAYRRKGPPPWLLRALGPAVVTLTIVVLATGIALLYAGADWHGRLLTAHKLSFVAWFVVMAVHVLGHLPETARLGLTDWVGRGRRWGPGTNVRRAAVLASVAAGIAAGAVVIGQVSVYLASTGFGLGG